MKTKKLLKVLSLGCLLLLFSCETESFQTQDNKSLIENNNLSNKLLPKGLCPDGFYEDWSYDFDFNFHRPVKNCETGFWFCSSGEWILECKSFSSTRQATMNETKAKVLAIVNRERGIITFHFPIGLINKPGNIKNDFEIFNVDEELKFGNITLIKRNYNSTFTSNEILIDVPVK